MSSVLLMLFLLSCLYPERLFTLRYERFLLVPHCEHTQGLPMLLLFRNFTERNALTLI